MYIKAIGLLALGFLLLLFATKPSREDFDHELDSTLREAISANSYDNSKDVLSNLTSLGCKLRTEDCLELIKKTYTISNRNYIFFTRNHVSGPGASITCWGVLKQFICGSTVSIPTIRNALKSLW
jgi:hypothetical protein